MHGDTTIPAASGNEMRPRARCDSLPDQSTGGATSKRKSILKKEAINREEMEGLLSGTGGAGSSRNSFATPLDGTPAKTGTDEAAEHAVDDDDDDQLVVRHLPRLSDSASEQAARRQYPLYVSQLPNSQSVATIAEFDTDCDEESSMEGELDSGRPDTRSRTDSASSSHGQRPPKYQYRDAGARGGDDGSVLDNVQSPQNANVPLSQAITDINLNLSLPHAHVAQPPPPPIPVRLRAPLAAADNLGNHLPSSGHPADSPRDTTSAFTHNLFPTLDFIDEFAD